MMRVIIYGSIMNTMVNGRQGGMGWQRGILMGTVYIINGCSDCYDFLLNFH